MRRLALIVVASCALGACSTSTTTTKASGSLDQTKVPVKIAVTSSAFANNGAIPRANTCDGAGVAPTISWGVVPAETKSVAVVVDDPDAPKGPFVHWVVVGLRAGPGHVPATGGNIHELDNTAGSNGWTPPCPPTGSTHHYRFTVYALSDYVCADNGDAASTADCSPPSSPDALQQIAGNALAKGTIVGTYQR